jgi:predicted phosphodiesterase
VVVYGHTHAPGRIGDYHFNTGSWARVNDTYVKIEDDGTAGVWEWVGTWPKPCNTKLG